MIPSRFAALAALVLAVSAPDLRAQPDLMVVVNPGSGVSQLTWDEVRNLFLGRQKSLVPGLRAQPVEQGEPAGVRSRFYHLLTHKELAEIDAYWARLLFSGQAHPPRLAGGSEAVVRQVLADKGAIGLLEGGRPDPRVKVVLVLTAPEAP